MTRFLQADAAAPNALPKALRTDVGDAFLAKVVAWTTVFAIFYECIGGAARFFLAKVGGLFVNNIPAVLTYISFCAYFAYAFRRRTIRPFMVFLLLMTLFYVVCSFGNTLLPLQKLMGFYIWSNFFLGVLLAAYEEEDTLFRWMPFFWGLTVTGVILNAFIDFPWIGETYEVAGNTMETSRKWDAAGFDRLPGFTRMNISAAVTILLCGVYMLVGKSYPAVVKVAIYVLSCVAMALTTAKTQLAQIVAFPLFFLPYWTLKRLKPETPAAMIYGKAMVIFLVVLVVGMPLTLSSHGGGKDTGTIAGYLTMDTMVDRMTQMWPEAFDLVEKHGNPLFGRGVGGVGSGAAFRDPKPDTVNSADNQFVYVYVQMGWFAALPFFLSFFANLGRLYKTNRRYFEVILALSYCILGIFITTPFEQVTLGIMTGFLVGRGYMPPRRFALEKPRY